MRVLRIFFSALITIGIVGAIAGLIAREILLYTALGQVRSGARELRFLETDPEFTQTCLDYAGLPPEGQSLTRLQLRFVSDKMYVLEAVCRGGESIRKVFRQETLPALVTKLPGQSGIVANQGGYALALSVMGRVGMIYEDGGIIHSSLRLSGDQQFVTNQGPATTCEGYGFECCNGAYQVGEGAQLQTAWDCPLSCYSQCADRPVVLSFNTDPESGGETRVLMIQSGDEVEFFYTVNDIQGDAFARAAFAADEAEQLTWEERFFRIVDRWGHRDESRDALEKVVITFGDGESAEFADLQGTTFHTYTCTRSLCVYNATVQAVTQQGLTSALESMSKIQIHVQP